jgi:hypothetical protein
MNERFHAGRTVAGSPSEAQVECFERWLPAAGYLIDTMREYATNDDELATAEATAELTGYATEEEWAASDDYPSMRSTVDAILTDDPPIEPLEFEVAIEDNGGRNVAFWLKRVVCDDEDSDD